MFYVIINYFEMFCFKLTLTIL